MCIILYRMQCDTTCLSTNVSWGWRTWKVPCGQWTKWNFTSAGPNGAQLGMSHRSRAGHASWSRTPL